MCICRTTTRTKDIGGVVSIDTLLMLADTTQTDYILKDETMKYISNTLKANYGALWHISQGKDRTT